MSPIQLLAESHRQHLEARNFSPCTLRNRAANLRQFFRFLKGKRIRDIKAVTGRVLNQYQLWLHRFPCQHGGLRTAATLNRGLATLKVFFRYLYETGTIDKNPARELLYAREPQPLPQAVLTPAEAKRVIESVAVVSLLGYRDRAILEVFYATGVRKSELLNLTLDDVNYDDCLLIVRHGKGGGDRAIPLGSLATRWVANYVKVVRPTFVTGTTTNRLFVSGRGRPVSGTALAELVKRHAAQAGVRKNMACHLWRHTCATHMVQNGANLRHVQEILGHQDLTTTERYLHLTILDLKAAHHKYHPREKGVALRQNRAQNGAHAGENGSSQGRWRSRKTVPQCHSRQRQVRSQSRRCVPWRNRVLSAKYTEVESGLVYYGFRWLRDGGWLSRDPAEEEGGPNLYECVGNNPITQVDELGLAFYAVDGTWTDASNRANPWQLYNETKETPHYYWRGPKLDGSDSAKIAEDVYQQIVYDFCEAKSACSNMTINLTGWSRGAMIAASVAQSLKTSGCWCLKGGRLQQYAPVQVNWVGLFDAVKRTTDIGFPTSAPSNVAHFDHAIKTGKSMLFPTWHFSGSNERAFNRNNGKPTSHRDIGESKLLGNNESYNWMKSRAVAAGVAF